MSNEGNKATLTPMEQLLGEELFVNQKKKGADIGVFNTKPTKSCFRDKEFVLLYFSAAWCPPCKAFTPILANFYKKYADTHKIQIVYVSSDQSLEQFDEYFGKMPWLAIPTDAKAAAIKSSLSKRLSIRGIPSLIVVQVHTGLFVTDKAREQIQKVSGTTAPNNNNAVQTVVEYWKTTPAMTLEEGGRQAAAFDFSLRGMVMAILKNPMYIFGLLYMFKWVMRNYKQWFGGALGDDTTTGGSTGGGEGGGGEHEF